MLGGIVVIMFIKYIKKHGDAWGVDNVHVVWAARGGSSSYKTLFFRAIFEGSWCPRLDEVACVPRFMKV
jgi:hypothetical protein